jgi:hypothetical protein
MARAVQVIETITSDLSGEAIEPNEKYEPFRFAIQSDRYEIDITPSEYAQFIDLITPYLDAARPAEKSRGKDTKPRRRPAKEVNAIRTWAAQTGFTLSDRGRIPAEVVEAYHRAQNGVIEATTICRPWTSRPRTTTPSTPLGRLPKPSAS